MNILNKKSGEKSKNPIVFADFIVYNKKTEAEFAF